MKQLGISIIGTDTDVGKTFVTGLLGAMAVDDGFAVGMVKPVSSSAVPFPECVTVDEDNYNVDLEVGCYAFDAFCRHSGISSS